MPEFETWLKNKLIFLGFTALTIGVAYLGYRVYKTRAQAHSSSSQLSPKRAAGGAQEFGLPKYCRCISCGHTIEMIGEYEGIHCPDLGTCKKCGKGKYMRAWNIERQ